jgi:hypothetical protein
MMSQELKTRTRRPTDESLVLELYLRVKAELKKAGKL